MSLRPERSSGMWKIYPYRCWFFRLMASFPALTHRHIILWKKKSQHWADSQRNLYGIEQAFCQKYLLSFLKHIEYWNIHYIKKPIFKTALRSKARSFSASQRQSPRQGDSPAVGFWLVPLGVEKIPRFYREKKSERSNKKRASFMQARLMLKPWLKLSHSIEKTPWPVHGLQCVWWDNKFWSPILGVEQDIGWTGGLDCSIAGKYPLWSV